MEKNIKIPSLFFKDDTKIDFYPEDINWDDTTVCALCRKIDCVCTIQICPCGKKANICNWPSDNCPCPRCLELIKDCKCKVIIKKEK